MACLRPATKRFAAKDIVDQSHLPLACVITPLAEIDESENIPKLSSIPKCQHCGAPHPHPTTPRCEFCGKEGLFVPTNDLASSDPTYCYRLPLKISSGASATDECPPLWFIVLQGGDSRYWRTISRTLTDVLSQLPSYIYISLVICSEKGSIGLAQLDSAIPHVQYYHQEDMSSEIMSSLVPIHSPHVTTILRSLLDFTTTAHYGITDAVNLIAQALHEHGQAAGNRNEGQYPYAGAKITVLSGQGQIQSTTTATTVGGRVLKPRFQDNDFRRAAKVKMDDDCVILGDYCAAVAAGVDVIGVLIDKQVDLDLAYGLSSASGSPGPMLIEDQDRLIAALIMSAPVDVAFDVNIRIRTSPGLTIQEFSGPGAPIGDALWRLGTCDSFTSLLVHFVAPQVATKTATVQTCVAYTTIDEDGQVLRLMRVTTLSVNMAPTVESLYASLDPEALAPCLFHKLTLIEKDNVEEVAKEWLVAVLVALYQSAERQEKGCEPVHAKFVAENRLLGYEEVEDTVQVLLAQGHSRIGRLPLLICLLLQSDAFKSTVARQQMSCMDPSTLTRCLAPRIQLWSRDDLLVDVVGLCFSDIESAIEDNPNAQILLIDTPWETSFIDVNLVRGDEARTIKIGPALEQTIAEIQSSYRTPPPVTFPTNLQTLVDTLVPDAPMTESHESFDEWEAGVAKSVSE